MVLDDLDDRRLTARWCSAVLAHDAALIAACEQEADRRGTIPLVAAAKKKKDKEGPYKSIGLDTSGMSLAEIARKSAKNRETGADWTTGFKTGATKKKGKGKGKGESDDSDKGSKSTGGKTKGGGGYNPFRKKAGSKGGGRFTNQDDPDATGKALVKAEKEARRQADRAEGDAETDAQRALDTERTRRNEARKAEDEAERQGRFTEDEQEKQYDADERAAAQARRDARDAARAVDAAEDADLATRIRANEDFVIATDGQIALAQRLLAEARTMGKDDDEIALTQQIETAQAAAEQARADRRALEDEKLGKAGTRAQRRFEETASEANASRSAAEAKRERQAALRRRREEARRAKTEGRAREDAEHQARVEALRARVDAARRARRASGFQDREGSGPPDAAPSNGRDDTAVSDLSGRVSAVPAAGARP